ncbi:DUF6197 family protein [Streptomyces albidoflavus]|uniref:DUF6197 family protein n=1 Tax=Streptomyces albidoflavus TaxID=1886 RepID=UPI0022501B6E|nr:hypothetical protein [Streptomyces albidoflavus]MCX4444772.1 hypothetical protein [Streptomyces albidoflavus]
MTTPTPAEVADVLDRAADHIDRVGWIQGGWYTVTAEAEPKDSPMDADSALMVAAGGTPIAALVSLTRAQTAVYYLAKAAMRHYTGYVGLVQWNDMSGRTKDEVTAVMRAAAAYQRKQVTS